MFEWSCNIGFPFESFEARLYRCVIYSHFTLFFILAPRTVPRWILSRARVWCACDEWRYTCRVSDAVGPKGPNKLFLC